MILNLEKHPATLLLSSHKTACFDDTHTLPPFTDDIIACLSALGLFLMKEGRSEPSIVAAGYWLRKKHLIDLKAEYMAMPRYAKGVCFHIAPGNVDTLFFYSMIVSVLCGNQTILRISNKLTKETHFFLELLNNFFTKQAKFSTVFSLINIIQYDHGQTLGNEITQRLSAFADARVIWGGDKTVAEISNIPQKKHADNITFPDRYSVAVIELQNQSQIEQAVSSLLTDIKPFNQQACSSPKAIYWLNTAQKLQEQCLTSLASKLTAQVALHTADQIEQLLYLQRLPLICNVEQINKLVVKNYKHLVGVIASHISLDMINAHNGNYVLLQQNINTLSDIKLFEHCQTVTCFGVDDNKWQYWLTESLPIMKRWVNAGKALAFSHQWDGIDLIESLTKLNK